MPNGLFMGYKRGGRRREKHLAWGGRSAAEPIRSFSLCSCFCFCSITSCAGFEEDLAVSRNAPSATCSTSGLFSRFCASRHTGIGICSPPCSFSLVSISCPTVGCNILPRYLFAFKGTYSLLFLSVSFFVRVFCVEGPCPCVILGSV